MLVLALSANRALCYKIIGADLARDLPWHP